MITDPNALHQKQLFLIILSVRIWFAGCDERLVLVLPSQVFDPNTKVARTPRAWRTASPPDIQVYSEYSHWMNFENF
jgi:hypothetical protein